MIVNSENNQFELKIGEHVASAKFRIEENNLFIDYVFAPPELRGTGAASDLMKEIANYAKEKNLKIIPICSYAVKWCERAKLK